MNINFAFLVVLGLLINGVEVFPPTTSTTPSLPTPSLTTSSTVKLRNDGINDSNATTTSNVVTTTQSSVASATEAVSDSIGKEKSQSSGGNEPVASAGKDVGDSTPKVEPSGENDTKTEVNKTDAGKSSVQETGRRTSTTITPITHETKEITTSKAPETTQNVTETVKKEITSTPVTIAAKAPVTTTAKTTVTTTTKVPTSPEQTVPAKREETSTTTQTPIPVAKTTVRDEKTSSTSGVSENVGSGAGAGIKVEGETTGSLDGLNIPDVPSRIVPKITSQEEVSGTSFPVLFMVSILAIVGGYFLYHNKSKIMGLIVEGRGPSNSRRSPRYNRLKNVEDAMPGMRNKISA